MLLNIQDLGDPYFHHDEYNYNTAYNTTYTTQVTQHKTLPTCFLLFSILAVDMEHSTIIQPKVLQSLIMDTHI